MLDEVQRALGLFSYLQEYLDDPHKNRHYILTGSHQFILMENITQSPAGRIVNFRLFPLTVNELYRQANSQALAQTDTAETSSKALLRRSSTNGPSIADTGPASPTGAIKPGGKSTC